MESVHTQEISDQNKLFTIGQVSTLTKIPVPTIRKYVKRYRDHISIVRGARNTALYSSEAIRKLILVRSLSTQHIHHSKIASLIAGQVQGRSAPGQDAPLKSEPVSSQGGSGQGCQNNLPSGQPLENKNFQLDLIKQVNVIRMHYESLQEENTVLKGALRQQAEVSSDLTKKLWALESEIGELNKGQGFWATICRWLGVVE
jgi:DNA-binding transcriptional MerR regulator